MQLRSVIFQRCSHGRDCFSPFKLVSLMREARGLPDGAFSHESCLRCVSPSDAGACGSVYYRRVGGAPFESVSELSKSLRGQTIPIVRPERIRVAMARILIMKNPKRGFA